MKCLDTVRPDNAATGPKNAPSQCPRAGDANSCEPVPHDASPRRKVVAEQLFNKARIAVFWCALNLNIHSCMLWLDGLCFNHPNGAARLCWMKASTHVIFGPLDFIARLVALVPKPFVNLALFHGDLRRMAQVPQVGDLCEAKQMGPTRCSEKSGATGSGSSHTKGENEKTGNRLNRGID